MIRFVYIGSQITDDSRDFAFFNTVTDKFEEINNCHVFSSIKEFEEYVGPIYIFGRLNNLIPDWYRKNDNPPNSSNSIQSKER